MRLLAVLTVAALALLAHAPSLGGGFVYDDHRFVEANEALDRLDVGAFFTDPATASAREGVRADIYRPLRTLDFAVSKRLFGTDPWPWHATNVLLHVLASLLVLRLLLPLLGDRMPPAAAGAALFAVHPATSEVVAWISSRGDLLALLLMLLSLLVLERRGWGRTCLGAALMGAACLAKESALVLPALLGLRDLALPGARALPARTTWVRVGVLAAVAGLYLLWRVEVSGPLAQVEGFAGGSREAAARGFLAGLAWYASALLLPLGFPFDVHLPVPLAWTEPAVVLGLGLLATLLLAGAWGLSRGRPLVAFAALGGLACLVPVSNVLVPLKALVAERFLYPVLPCLAAGLGAALVRWGRTRDSPVTSLVWVLVLGALTAGVFLTRERDRWWTSDLALWQAVLEDRPDHLRAYEGLGYGYHSAEPPRLREAELAYRSYLDYNPIDGKTWYLLGNVLGDVAGSLRLERLAPNVETDVAERRHAIRVAQIQAYNEALRVWTQAPLVVGRGSEAMRRRTLESILRAAADLGDLDKVKQVNDLLLLMEDVDPRDVEAVFARGSLPRRRVRLNAALAALLAPPRDLDPALAEVRAAQRASVLRDVGLDPALEDRAALRALRPRFEALVGEGGFVPEDGLNLAGLLLETGDVGAAEALLRDLARRHPGDRRVERLLVEVVRRGPR